MAVRSERARVRRWRRYLADERAEGALYRELAGRYTGEEREILLGLADAEQRHERHWVRLLGDEARDARASLGSRLLIHMARRFGSLFVLTLVPRRLSGTPLAGLADAELLEVTSRIQDALAGRPVPPGWDY